MLHLDEVDISRAIISEYHKTLSDRMTNDVVIVGAGPAGMVAAYRLAKQGLKVSVIEKRLAVGGGIWGGGMAMHRAVIQESALGIIEEFGVSSSSVGNGLFAVNSVELATGLCFKAIQAGAEVFNLTTVEDVCVHKGRVDGVVINRTMIVDALPVDPIMMMAKVVIDTTGHEAYVVDMLRKRGLINISNERGQACEQAMDVDSGERFVEENAQEVFPGLWVSGMSVCATLGGARMGPIFGGMLLSGRRVSDLVIEHLKKG